jgi:hypothetical protein
MSTAGSTHRDGVLPAVLMAWFLYKRRALFPAKIIVILKFYVALPDESEPYTISILCGFEWPCPPARNISKNFSKNKKRMCKNDSYIPNYYMLSYAFC